MFTLDNAPLANQLGFLALVAYIVTLLPTNVRIVFPETKQMKFHRWILKNRRIIGILSFAIAVVHGFLLIKKRDIDLFEPSTCWIYIQGVSSFIIFFLLAITSNDWCVKKLKKNWKHLHNLTYLALFLVTWHIYDKMSDHFSFLTPIGLVAVVSMIVLYLKRRVIEDQNEQTKAQKKLSSPTPLVKISTTSSK